MHAKMKRVDNEREKAMDTRYHMLNMHCILVFNELTGDVLLMKI